MFHVALQHNLPHYDWSQSLWVSNDVILPAGACGHEPVLSSPSSRAAQGASLRASLPGQKRLGSNLAGQWQGNRANSALQHSDSCLQRIWAKIVSDEFWVIFSKWLGMARKCSKLCLQAPWKPSEASARNCCAGGRAILCATPRDRSVSSSRRYAKEFSSSIGCHTAAVLGTAFTATHIDALMQSCQKKKASFWRATALSTSEFLPPSKAPNRSK